MALSEKSSIFTLFGGQGTNEVYFDELQNLYDIYRPFVALFVKILTEDVLIPLVAEEEASTYYMFGLDVLSWLSGATAHPAVPYFALVPISFPLIGFTQLVQYLVICHVSNLTLANFAVNFLELWAIPKVLYLLLSSQHQAPSKSSLTTPTKPSNSSSIPA